MKRKIQRNAVNKQEDEDSCAYPAYFPRDAPVEIKEDSPDKESSGQPFSDAPDNKDESTSNRE